MTQGPSLSDITFSPKESNNETVYIGTKIVKAKPMSSIDFKISKGIEVGNEENAPGYRVEYEDGYVSWSPAWTFEKSYRLLSMPELKLINTF